MIRQLLAESLCLGLGGAALGALIASAGVRAIVWLKPERLPRMSDIRLDVPVLAFAVFVALVSAVLFGLYPALHGTPCARRQTRRYTKAGEERPSPAAERVPYWSQCKSHFAQRC